MSFNGMPKNVWTSKTHKQYCLTSCLTETLEYCDDIFNIACVFLHVFFYSYININIYSRKYRLEKYRLIQHRKTLVSAYLSFQYPLFPRSWRKMVCICVNGSLYMVLHQPRPRRDVRKWRRSWRWSLYHVSSQRSMFQEPRTWHNTKIVLASTQCVL